jgi:hypothetical protein
MNKLDKQGQCLLSVLVKHLDKVVPGDPLTYIGYKDIHEILNLHQLGGTWGRSLQHQGLNTLADWTKAEKKPAITGIIISTLTLEPGLGYFALFGRKEDDYGWWKEQVCLSIELDWTPYLHD